MWGYTSSHGDGHSKHATQQQKNAAVSQQFEAVLVKQFLKEALTYDQGCLQ